jgi:hypothetical protein
MKLVTEALESRDWIRNEIISFEVDFEPKRDSFFYLFKKEVEARNSSKATNIIIASTC